MKIPQLIALLSPVIILTALLSSPPSSVAAESIEVRNAWIRATPATIPVMAAYLDIVNSSAHAYTLIAAASHAFEYIQFHRSEIQQGLVKMRHQKHIIIPANTTLTFKPGGYHLMLVNKQSTITTGQNIPIKLLFKHGTSLSFHASVKKNAAIDIPIQQH